MAAPATVGDGKEATGGLSAPGSAAPAAAAAVAAGDGGDDAEIVAAVPANLAAVRARLSAAVAAAPQVAAANDRSVELIAVSKFKSAAVVRAAYEAGQRVFGENYVVELVEKAAALEPAAAAATGAAAAATAGAAGEGGYEWHFIGHLQSNKAKPLLRGVPNLAAVHTVDSLKLARVLNAAAEEQTQSGARTRGPLCIALQVNTSGEASKAGLSAPADDKADDEEAWAPLRDLARTVAGKEFPHLRLWGVMTIGSPGGGAEDFERLKVARRHAAQAAGIESEGDLALSMGMSADFEDAIAHGATHVRVGSSIFGARPPKPE